MPNLFWIVLGLFTLMYLKDYLFPDKELSGEEEINQATMQAADQVCGQQ